MNRFFTRGTTAFLIVLFAGIGLLAGRGLAADTPTAAEPVLLAQAEEPEITPEDVYYFACALCHRTGLNAAPKFGDRRAWEPRIAKGRVVMYQSTMEGKGAMPAKGGKPNLTDEQVYMAVDYMVEAVGGWPEEEATEGEVMEEAKEGGEPEDEEKLDANGEA